jgi:hypothetical protein
LSCACVPKARRGPAIPSWVDAVTAPCTTRDEAADVEQAFAAWLNVPPPQERDTEADRIATQLLGGIAEENYVARWVQSLVGDNLIEIGRAAVVTNSRNHQDQLARAERDAILTFEPIAGVAPGVGRTLVVEWRHLPNLYELAEARRINRRQLAWGLEQLGRELHHGQNAGRMGGGFAALKIARGIFMPALVTGKCPEPMPIAVEAPEREDRENPPQRPPAGRGAARHHPSGPSEITNGRPVSRCDVSADRAFDQIRNGILSLGAEKDGRP